MSSFEKNFLDSPLLAGAMSGKGSFWLNSATQPKQTAEKMTPENQGDDDSTGGGHTIVIHINQDGSVRMEDPQLTMFDDVAPGNGHLNKR